MIKATIDLNVIIDFLNKRAFHTEAAEILQLSLYKKIRSYVCAHEITALSYFLSKQFQNRFKTKNIIKELLDFISVIEINKSILLESLNSQITDFEDAVIEASSKLYKVKYIITGNITDFKKSTVQTITPLEFLALYHKSQL